MVKLSFVVKDEMGMTIKHGDEVEVLVEGEKEQEEAAVLEAFVKENI